MSSKVTQEVTQETQEQKQTPLFSCVTTPQALYTVLKRVQSCINKRSTLPILQCVTLTREQDGRILVYATNLEWGIVEQLRESLHSLHEQQEACRIAIPFEPLLKMLASVVNVKTMRFQPLAVQQVSENTLLCTVARETTVFTLSFDASEYPSMPAMMQERLSHRPSLQKEKEEEWLYQLYDIPVEAVRQIATSVGFSAGTDDSRPILTGIAVRPSVTSGLSCAAADSFRLSIIEYPALKQAHRFADEQEWIIPAQVWKTLVKLLPKQGTVRLRSHVEDKQRVTILFEVYAESPALFHATTCLQPLFLMASRLIEGTYPNYRQLVPQSPYIRIQMPVERVLYLCRKFAPITQVCSNILRIRLTFDESQLVAHEERIVRSVSLHVAAEDIGKDDVDITSECRMVIVNEHPDAVAFVQHHEQVDYILNSRYLKETMESLQKLGCSTCHLLVSTPERPVLFEPAVPIETKTFASSPGVQHVIMPMSTR